MNQLPEIEVLETEEMWSQRAIDTPDEVLDELQKLKTSRESKVDCNSTSKSSE